MSNTSEFEKNKRQVFIFEGYVLNKKQWFDELVTPHFYEDIANLTNIPEGLLRAWRIRGTFLCDLLYVRYTAGEPIEPLRDSLSEIVEAYKNAAAAERELENDPSYPFFALRHIDDYVRFVGLLSVAILLHREDLIPAIHGLIAGSAFDEEDALVEELLTRYMHSRPYLDEWFIDEPYRYLLDATAADTPAMALSDMKLYLKKWYQGMSGTGWFDSHKRMNDNGMGAYSGYWAWEAGAIAYLHNIDDSTITSPYYPKDMVAYARSVSPPPSGSPPAPKDPSNTCLHGEPCPKTGMWFSFAYNQSLYFTKGQIMPEHKGEPKAWETIWYFRSPNKFDKDSGNQ